MQTPKSGYSFLVINYTLKANILWEEAHNLLELHSCPKPLHSQVLHGSFKSSCLASA